MVLFDMLQVVIGLSREALPICGCNDCYEFNIDGERSTRD